MCVELSSIIVGIEQSESRFAVLDILLSRTAHFHLKTRGNPQGVYGENEAGGYPQDLGLSQIYAGFSVDSMRSMVPVEPLTRMRSPVLMRCVAS